MEIATPLNSIPLGNQRNASAQRVESGTTRSADEVVQSVFAEVLAAAGRQGYESAQSRETTEPLDQAVASSWEGWFNESSAMRYTFVAGAGSPSVRPNRTAADLRDDYRQILIDAYQHGGYSDPEGFLRTLDSEQLATIQQVHHLADPIRVASLLTEASLNLLLPPSTQVDEDRDGLTAVGAAYTLRFPDSNTPVEVREAWELTTAGMSESDRALHEMHMKFALVTANIHFDQEGNFLGSSDPGDSDWVNPQASPDFSYSDYAQDWLDYLQNFSKQIPAEQYQRDYQFWSTFLEHLNA
jgi:hypothetical protein